MPSVTSPRLVSSITKPGRVFLEFFSFYPHCSFSDARNSRRPLCVHSQGHHGQDQRVLRWQVSPNCVKRVGPIIKSLSEFYGKRKCPDKESRNIVLRNRSRVKAMTSTEKLRSGGAGVYFVLGCFSFKAPSFTYLAAHTDMTRPPLGKLLEYSHDEINNGIFRTQPFHYFGRRSHLVFKSGRESGVFDIIHDQLFDIIHDQLRTSQPQFDNSKARSRLNLSGSAQRWIATLAFLIPLKKTYAWASGCINHASVRIHG